MRYRLVLKDGKGRRQPSQTIVPVSILQLIQYSEDSGPLEVCGVVVGLVKVIGQVAKQNGSVFHVSSSCTKRRFKLLFKS
jgi:hypothetical protein